MQEYICKGKINLNLKVLGRREDGYHNIKSIMSELDFGDILRVKKSDCCDGFRCNIKSLNRNNLVLKALEILRSEYRVGPTEIELIKNLPIASGMGGGSSDATNFLLAMKKEHDLPISRDDLFEMARMIGMDVSFFIDGGIQIATERGDVLEKIDGTKKDVLVVYDVPSLSENIYKSMNEDDFNTDSYNDLLNPVLRNNGELKNFYDHIMQFADFKMTGAGGAFYLIDEYDELVKISNKINAKYKKIGKVFVPTGEIL